MTDRNKASNHHSTQPVLNWLYCSRSQAACIALGLAIFYIGCRKQAPVSSQPAPPSVNQQGSSPMSAVVKPADKVADNPVQRTPSTVSPSATDECPPGMMCATVNYGSHPEPGSISFSVDSSEEQKP